MREQPVWCTKQKPCDFDPPTAYCPHRECRQREHELIKLLCRCKPDAGALKAITMVMRKDLTGEQILLLGEWIDATEKADELMKVDPRPPV